jgi:hypothetical protein
MGSIIVSEGVEIIIPPSGGAYSYPWFGTNEIFANEISQYIINGQWFLFCHGVFIYDDIFLSDTRSTFAADIILNSKSLYLLAGNPETTILDTAHAARFHMVVYC